MKKVFVLSILLFVSELLNAQTITDIDGNVYKTVIIQDQEWMAENLRVVHYPDGSPIPLKHTDSTGDAYCWYNNDSLTNAGKYGALYTWAAAMKGKASSSGNPSGVQGVCPTGWHLPSISEWHELFAFGEKLKDSVGWNRNGNGTNEVGFSALPGGIGHGPSNFYHEGIEGYWSSSTEHDTSTILYFYMHYSGDMEPIESIDKSDFISVRCVKGNTVSNPPTLPTNPLPANNADSVSLYPRLNWSCSDPEHDDIFYDLYLDTLNARTLQSENQSDTSFLPAKLLNNKTYYWKVMARDSHGNETEGSVWSFKTAPDRIINGEGVTDFDGNSYKTTIIGDQEWMSENLRVTHYSNGEPIPKVTGNDAWSNLGIDTSDDAFCWYNNDSLNYHHFGAYYTWAAAMQGSESSKENPSNIQGVCPTGWHLPSSAEWVELLDYVKSNSTEGKTAFALKSTEEWLNKGNGSDEFGFNATPYAYRPYYYGEFVNIGENGYWWSSETYGAESDNFVYDSLFAFSLGIRYNDFDELYLMKEYYTNGVRSSGFSVRCVKDKVILNTKTVIEKLSVYPNPAKDKIYLNDQGFLNGTIHIYNLQGQEVLTRQMNANMVDVSSLSRGLYLIQVIGVNKKFETKFIIE